MGAPGSEAAPGAAGPGQNTLSCYLQGQVFRMLFMPVTSLDPPPPPHIQRAGMTVPAGLECKRPSGTQWCVAGPD